MRAADVFMVLWQLIADGFLRLVQLVLIRHQDMFDLLQAIKALLIGQPASLIKPFWWVFFS